MERFSDNQFPLCRFGPGGEFVKDWPFGKSMPQENSLGDILRCIAEIINCTSQVNDQMVETILSAGQKRDKTNDKDSPESQTDPKAARTAADNRKLSPQPMLFADDSRTGAADRAKPKHRIRAYSATAKKRLSIRITGQGSLFESNFKSLKSA